MRDIPATDASNSLGTASRKRRMASDNEPAPKRRHLLAEVGGDEQTEGQEEAPLAEEKSLVTTSSDTMAGPADSTDLALGLFTTVLEDIRVLVTCSICFRMLYEPYTLSCGHTHCYSCLSQWFGETTSKKKTCPNCRAVVTSPPAPAYLVRELTHKLISKPEFLADGETLEFHTTMGKEEAEAIDRDKLEGNGGLFKGAFEEKPSRRRRGPIFDHEDRVQRCPYCNWELYHGICEQCGEVDSADDEENASDDDDSLEGIDDLEPFEEREDDDADGTDSNIDSDAAEEEELRAEHRRRRRHTFLTNSMLAHLMQQGDGHSLPFDLRDVGDDGEEVEEEDDDDDDEDEDTGSDLDGFIVEEEEEEEYDPERDLASSTDGEADEHVHSISNVDGNGDIFDGGSTTSGDDDTVPRFRSTRNMADQGEQCSTAVSDSNEESIMPIDISSDDVDAITLPGPNNQRSRRSRRQGRARRLVLEDEDEDEDSGTDALTTTNATANDTDDEDEDGSVTRRLRRSAATSGVPRMFDALASTRGTRNAPIYPYSHRVTSSTTNYWRRAGDNSLHSNSSNSHRHIRNPYRRVGTLERTSTVPIPSILLQNISHNPELIHAIHTVFGAHSRELATMPSCLIPPSHFDIDDWPSPYHRPSGNSHLHR